ncbi:conserved protein of unknown function [Tenacibaculum sp. 190130A14a]|uniref:Uncharacterized protein n=1 Tax=Tenacibaculum polynesiense TaxID=3137857 RepID=A0ABP1F1I3_9FLAO
MSVPTYGSLQNQMNKEYRCNHAAQLKKSYESPECLMNFVEQSNGSYGIKNVKNNEYFDSSITTMTKKVSGASEQWRLLALPDVENGYYVQNVKNNEFMTSSASQLSSKAGSKEIWIIEERQS